MLNISITLKHYKRKDVQEAILNSSGSREVAVRFGDNGFGKRPDTLSYPNDILEYAKQGATSFHVSEEHWNNVLRLNPNMSKKDQEDLRKGWDLVLDIDCKYWYYSKLITKLAIDQLKEHGIESISVKFSGSKGFHIGVPFEAFPGQWQGKDTASLFPEAPRRIAIFLKDKIEPILLKELMKDKTKKEIAEMVNKPEEELFKIFCKKCGAETKTVETKIYFICPKCQTKEEGNEKYRQCKKCNTFMEMVEIKGSDRCYKCDSEESIEKFNSSLILDIDTLLISSRHMYRMPYSLHEKSGLCSIVIPTDRVMGFMKDDALPSKINPKLKFLDTTKTKNGEATRLLVEAFDYKPIVNIEKIELDKKYEIPEEAIPMELFPPCILKGMNGLEDGKKRFMFALMNHLENCGYGYEAIENIVKEWNTKNKEQLREVLINGQLRYRKVQNKKKILPPNCMNFYQELQLCSPDHVCSKIKNPVQYAKYKSFLLNMEKNSGRVKLTEEQKEMRKKHRDKTKEKDDVENDDMGNEEKIIEKENTEKKIVKIGTEIKAVIFDMDGVLTDSEKFKAEAWKKVLKGYNVKDGDSWYIKRIGTSRKELAAEAIKTFSLEVDIDEVIERKKECYNSLIENSLEPMIESVEFLRNIDRKKFRTGLASSSGMELIRKQLDAIKIHDYFDVIISGEDDVKNNKPHPDIYLLAAEKLGVYPKECTVIEDSIAGIKSAKNAGMRCIALKNEYNKDKDLSEADEIVDRLTNIELPK